MPILQLPITTASTLSYLLLLEFCNFESLHNSKLSPGGERRDRGFIYFLICRGTGPSPAQARPHAAVQRRISGELLLYTAETGGGGQDRTI